MKKYIKIKPKKAEDGYVDSGINWEGPTGYMNTTKKKFDYKNSILGGLAFIDNLLPTQPINMPIVQPGQTYNQNPYGISGSQALFEKGGTVSSIFQEGSEHDLDEGVITNLIKQGYKIQYL